MTPDYIAPEIAIPLAIVLWFAVALVFTAPKRRARRRVAQIARAEAEAIRHDAAVERIVIGAIHG